MVSSRLFRTTSLRELFLAIALCGLILSLTGSPAEAQGIWVAGNLAYNGVTNNSFHYNYLELGYSSTGTPATLLVYLHELNEGTAWYTEANTNPLYLAAPLASGGAGPQDWYNNATMQSR
jgi:hypothetical protein